MRYPICFIMLVCSCSTKPTPPAPPTPRALESMVDVADPDLAAQVVTGFHAIEWGDGRWTKQSFSVLLRPPRTASQRGATLRVKFDLPQPLIEHEKIVSLFCTVAGAPQPPETFTSAGAHVYSRDLPKLTTSPVAVNCKVDKKFSAPNDSRELGLVLRAVGLEPN